MNESAASFARNYPQEWDEQARAEYEAYLDQEQWIDTRKATDTEKRNESQ